MSEYELVRPVIEYLPLAVIVINKDREVLLANKTAQVMSNKTENELIGLKGGEALKCKYAHQNPQGCGFAEHCRVCTIKNSVLASFKNKESIQLNDTPMEFEGIGIRSLRVSISYLNLNEVNKKFEGDRRTSLGRRKSDFNKEIAIVALEDITEFKNTQKLGAAMEIVGAICHEMNQPLQAILGYSGLINTNVEVEDLDKLRKTVKNLSIQTERLGELTKKLMGLKTYKTKSYLKTSILDIEESSK